MVSITGVNPILHNLLCSHYSINLCQRPSSTCCLRPVCVPVFFTKNKFIVWVILKISFWCSLLKWFFLYTALFMFWGLFFYLILLGVVCIKTAWGLMKLFTLYHWAVSVRRIQFQKVQCLLFWLNTLWSKSNWLSYFVYYGQMLVHLIVLYLINILVWKNLILVHSRFPCIANHRCCLLSAYGYFANRI